MIPALDPVTLIGVGIGLVGGLLAYILNQTDHVAGSGIVLLGSTALAIAWVILGHVVHAIQQLRIDARLRQLAVLASI